MKALANFPKKVNLMNYFLNKIIANFKYWY